jgi:hypothetical protein
MALNPAPNLSPNWPDQEENAILTPEMCNPQSIETREVRPELIREKRLLDVRFRTSLFRSEQPTEHYAFRARSLITGKSEVTRLGKGC